MFLFLKKIVLFLYKLYFYSLEQDSFKLKNYWYPDYYQLTYSRILRLRFTNIEGTRQIDPVTLE